MRMASVFNRATSVTCNKTVRMDLMRGTVTVSMGCV